ncbi:hypothetical protein K432DRAFT_397104 [Lepidopterella palustris CBS 459.81]|uniref:Uncharacterized protein n=1 Tax=Lepidopterella palustris CBS 459.81 TaxID=1314670 RepID=A0A8E2E1Q2_9PEZI|nr:hypothetical protein K432DRAFT_397104 [Lepidopterella palustris CBS 459.81]
MTPQKRSPPSNLSHCSLSKRRPAQVAQEPNTPPTMEKPKVTFPSPPNTSTASNLPSPPSPSSQAAEHNAPPTNTDDSSAPNWEELFKSSRSLSWEEMNKLFEITTREERDKWRRECGFQTRKVRETVPTSAEELDEVGRAFFCW